MTGRTDGQDSAPPDAPRPGGGAGRAAELVSAAMFACVFLVFVYKVAMRYLAQDAVAWADEVVVVLFVWIIFWANAFVVRSRDQIRFDLVARAVPARAQRLMALARLLLVGGIFVRALPGSVDYILFLWRERTPVLQWRLDVVYACFGLFMAAVVARSAWGLVRLLGPGWRGSLDS